MAKKTKANPQESLIEEELSAEDLALLSAAFSTLAQVFTFLSLLKVKEGTKDLETSQGFDGFEINMPPFRHKK